MKLDLVLFCYVTLPMIELNDSNSSLIIKNVIYVSQLIKDAND